MIKWFEKHYKISFILTLLIAIAIFYISTLTFLPGKPVFDIKPYLYHFFAFFFLCLFLLVSLVQGKINKSLFFISIIISILYGISDEFHQLFVPGRSCSFADVMLDTSGILFASFLYAFRIRNKK